MLGLEVLLPWAIKALQKAGEFGKEWKDQRLSDIEKEMLILTEANSCEIVIFSSEETGEFVTIGHEDDGKAYYDSQDKLPQKEGMETLAKLIARDLVRQEGEHFYELTASGIRKARSLKLDI
jgi:predicted secreted Zn-dependent protease